jgi:hypothetical protein
MSISSTVRFGGRDVERPPPPLSFSHPFLPRPFANADWFFLVCETPIVTQDLEEGTTTLFMRRSEMPLPDGCWDSYLEVTRQGASGSPP